MKHIYLLGAGGVGSWLTPAICLLSDPDNITVIDADILEEKNLNRQLFSVDDIGKSKAEALANTYGCQCKAEWYSHGLMALDKSDWLLVCVDNHPARAAALMSCDAFGCRAIFGANEVTSAEAYFYDPLWKDMPKLDPRKYYPEIETDHSGDPSRAAIGCTGEAQKANRQLVTANFMAAALMQHLFVVWTLEAPKLPREAREHLPFKLVQNLSANQCFKVKDAQNE